MASRRNRAEGQDEPDLMARNKLPEEGMLLQSYEEEEGDGKEDWSDPEVVYANRFRDYWNHVWAGAFGSFEDVTAIPPMLYTSTPCPSARPRTILQIFSVKVAAIKDSLQWPLDVYGFVAARDFLDQNRNIIFSRSRDNCQKRTNRSYLSYCVVGSYRFEVGLKVKGTNKSEDKDLSILVVPFLKGIHTCVVNGVYSSSLSSLDLTFGHLVHSVEATISLKVLSGSCSDGFGGIFAASTTSIDDKEVSWLAFEDGKFPVTHDGLIQPSRRVACVELKGELKVSIVPRCQDEDRAIERDNMDFTPKEAGISSGILKVSSCEMEVIDPWSLLSSTPFFGTYLRRISIWSKLTGLGGEIQEGRTMEN
ncbi:hypothetical protein ZWY2020_033549 [Hordeum vulgare]|nr:hypothetical protein ZWY2020_033549 [Hordeum vulgare]